MAREGIESISVEPLQEAKRKYKSLIININPSLANAMLCVRLGWGTKLKNMRKIKFRFWDKDLKKMCHRKPLTYDFSVENIIPLQFTGHKDCDGKEIFDGDILGDWNECDGQMVLSNEVVYFDETLGSWMLDHSLKKDHSFAISLFENLNDFAYKVIGNIYENPDLVVVASEADA